MKIRILPIFLLFCVSFLVFGPTPSHSETVSEGGVTINVGRVLHGASSGTLYYGYAGGKITLPHDRGGLLSFYLWNDMQVNGLAHTNYFVATIGGMQVQIPNYTTRNQLREEYNEFRGSWGSAGVYRVTLAIPPGTSAFDFGNQGSATGIEISNLNFVEGYRPLPNGYQRDATRPYGEPMIQVGRVLVGTKTGRNYYGYAGGSIFLPHGSGGFLTFKFWNDQHTGFSSTVNKINLTVGSRQESFSQYSTSLELPEEYKGLENQWGPAGAGEISIQIPEEIYKVDFNNAGSQTGIEISDVQFSKGAPIVIQFQERVNRTSEVLKAFGRILHGASSGRDYYGYGGGQVILPNTKGGVLSFLLWNDHHKDTAQTNNQLNITAGALKQTIQQATLQKDRVEFYKEYLDQWGPAGGMQVRVTVPQGVGLVDFNNGGSQTGIELTDLSFGSN